MLANSLTVEDEEAVQRELQELQMAEVLTILYPTLYEHGTHTFQLVVEPGQPEAEIMLPSPPTKRPVEEGKAISGAYFSHLLKHHVRGVRATNRGTRTGGSGSLIRISYTLSYCVQY